MKHFARSLRAVPLPRVGATRRLYTPPPAAAFLSASYGLGPDTAALYDAASAFAKAEFAPHAAAWDESCLFPELTLRKAAAQGYGSLWASSEHGGSELSRLDSIPVLEAFAEACPSTAAYMSIHSMVASFIDKHGSQELRARVLPRLSTMQHFASYCLTEPGAGSDAASLATRAVREDAGGPGGGPCYVLSGSKAFISGGGRSDVYLVMARTGGAGAGGVSAFVVDATTPGISFGAQERKLGWHSQPTCSVFFDSVRVPAANLVGAEGEGFKYAMSALDGGRLSIAACSLGAASASYAHALAHVRTREQFGAPLAALQGVQNALAESAIALVTSRAVLHAAARALDARDPAARALCALAKASVTEQCLTVCDRGVQLLGGYGYLRSAPVERLLRDARVHTILEGTSEIMRVVLARALLAPGGV